MNHNAPAFPSTDDIPGPMDLALEAAFEPQAHTPGDVLGVREELAGARMPRIPDHELVGFARAWLDAAMFLRTAQLPVTFATLAGVVAAGHTAFASVHARQLLALAAAPANERPRPGVRRVPAPVARNRGRRTCTSCGRRCDTGVCDSCAKDDAGPITCLHCYDSPLPGTMRCAKHTAAND